MMKKIGLCIILSIFVLGCFTISKFSRINGTKNADLHGIRVYAGPVPADASYKSLGKLSVSPRGWMTLQRLDRGLDELTIKAKELGANAIIDWKFTQHYSEGEAVIFDKFPSTYNDKYYKDN